MPKDEDGDRFTNALHALSAAFHMERLDPRETIVLLPREHWWRLWCSLERKYRGTMLFDGRQQLAEEFQYMGFTFKVK